MSDIIQLLPDSVANQIAAGEVIQRPASVVKELVENAVDAGAKTISVLITDAGRTAIQVIDDGKGMSDTDARLAFERHATSKIRKADDLFSLTTMGFRGEALPSIAAVAQVELKTRTADQPLGTHVSIAASKVTDQQPVACPVGSNFSVENIFFNVPARRKFLKTNTTELNNILATFERIALVYPDIHFTLQSNGTEHFNLRPGSLRQRIVDIVGKKLNQDIIPIEVDTQVCHIYGFVGKPEAARKKQGHQYFFVNGRFMKHPYFHRAVQTAFERLVPQGEQVPYFIYFDVKPEDIDVNIHPTKTEIKFENENTIWQILLAAIKDAIGRFNDIPAIDFDTENKPDIPVFNPDNADVAVPEIAIDKNYNPFSQEGDNAYAPPTTPSFPSHTTHKRKASAWERLYGNLLDNGAAIQPNDSSLMLPNDGTCANHPLSDSNPLLTNDQPLQDPLLTNNKQQQGTLELPLTDGDTLATPQHYQYKGRYILIAVVSGLMIIDQYRAHMRILYEKYLGQLARKSCSSVQMLFPEMLQFAPSEAVVLDGIMPKLEQLGFDISALGGGSYVINAYPADLDNVDIPILLHNIVNDSVEQADTNCDDINNNIALQLARNAAIPYGQVLSNTEMEHLITKLFACTNVNYTPDGRPIVHILKNQDIDKMFG